jgi:hypothetical protein
MSCACGKNIKCKCKGASMQNENIEFRKEEIKQPEGEIKKKLNMMQSFASAITSRGFKNEKVTKPIKQLRVLSCFGDKETGGVLPPCEHLKNSKTQNKSFCAGCGCGDRQGTWLTSDGDKYSKLDYPRLACPLQMPGFSNYEQSKPDEAITPITRRHYIENYPYEKLEKISVNVFDPPPEVKNNQGNTGSNP